MSILIPQQAFAPAYAKAGAKAIVLVARNLEKLNDTARELNRSHPGVETLVVPVDITSDKDISALFAKVHAAYGHADVLINNAGVLNAAGPLAEADPGPWWADFETNARGTLLVTSHFLRALPAAARGTLVTLTSGLAWLVDPGNSAYSLGKLVNLQMAAYVAAEAPNVTSVSLHPGIVPTDMTQEAFRPFALDTPELVGGVGVWLATERARFMDGRVMNSNWDVDDLYERRDEIVEGRLLRIDIQGTFGPEQFETSESKA